MGQSREMLRAIQRHSGLLKTASRRLEQAHADVDAAVWAARAEDVSWQEIGWALGMSGQGAQQRYVRRQARSGGGSPQSE